MCVGGVGFGIVPDADVLAVAALAAGEPEDAVAGGHDRRPGRRGEVDPPVHLRIAQDRMPAHAELGGEAGAVERGPEKRTAEGRVGDRWVRTVVYLWAHCT